MHRVLLVSKNQYTLLYQNLITISHVLVNAAGHHKKNVLIVDQHVVGFLFITKFVLVLLGLTTSHHLVER